MLLIECPYCGPRAEIEFRHGGEAHLVRPTGDAGDWAAYLYARENIRGRAAERWRHSYGCGQFFNAVRNTVSDAFECSYPTGDPPQIGSHTGQRTEVQTGADGA